MIQINKILICDDHIFFRNGLKVYITNYFDEQKTIFEASNGKEVLNIFLKHKPELVLLDIEVPYLNGINICDEIKRINPQTLVIFISMHKDETILTAMQKVKANGYVCKSNTHSELSKCLDVTINQSEVFFPNRIVNGQENKADKNYDRLRFKINSLSNTEKKVVELMIQGKTSQQITELLFIAMSSLHTYRGRICKKLELEPRNNSLNHWLFDNKEALKVFFQNNIKN